MKVTMILISYLLIFPAHIFAKEKAKSRSLSSVLEIGRIDSHIAKMENSFTSGGANIYDENNKKVSVKEYLSSKSRDLSIKFDDERAEFYVKVKKG